MIHWSFGGETFNLNPIRYPYPYGRRVAEFVQFRIDIRFYLY